MSYKRFKFYYFFLIQVGKSWIVSASCSEYLDVLYHVVLCPFIHYEISSYKTFTNTLTTSSFYNDFLLLIHLMCFLTWNVITLHLLASTQRHWQINWKSLFPCVCDSCNILCVFHGLASLSKRKLQEIYQNAAVKGQVNVTNCWWGTFHRWMCSDTMQKDVWGNSRTC